MTQKKWIILIVLGAVAVNTGAYLGLRSRRASHPSELQPVPAIPNGAQPPAARAEPPAAPAPEKPPAEEANEGLARARRAAGLVALEDRDYDKAVSEFTEALSLRKDKGDLVELLRIATDLKARENKKSASAPTPAKPPPEPPPSRSSSKSKSTRVASVRTPARPERPEPTVPEPEQPRNGLLLVTSTPPGLVVMVDGKAMDMTPARVQVRAGTHRVALAQGDRKLFEDSVQVEEDSVQAINRDLTAELAPPTPKPAPERAATPAVAAAAPAPTPARATTPEPVAAPPPAPTPAPAAAARPAAGGKGGLEVTSPGLYGEVWINNRPFGFPPVTAQGLPAGQAKVEIRVNGQVKRRMSVDVEPDRVSTVRIR